MPPARKPTLIILSGPPGAGKTTIARPLARHLELPLFEKDVILERLADAFATAADENAQQLGEAAVQQILAVAEELLAAGRSVMIECFFFHGPNEADLRPLLERADAVLVHLSAEPPLLESRVRGRGEFLEEHPIHKTDRNISELQNYIALGYTAPLELDIPTIEIDTTWGPVDVEELAAMVQELLQDAQSSR